MKKGKIIHNGTRIKDDRSMKIIGQLLKISILVAIIAIGSVCVAQAFNPQPYPPGCTSVGITNTQTARFSVVNVSNHLRDLYPPDPPDPPDPVHVRLSFFDSEGNCLRVMERTVGPGQVISLDLRGSELGLEDTERMQIYAIAEFPGAIGARMEGNATTKAGLEIFNTQTGVTSLALPVVTTYLQPVDATE